MSAASAPKFHLQERSPSEFTRDPKLGYRRGRRWAYFAFAADAFGYALWGDPDPDDVEDLTRLWRTDAERNRAPHTVLADLSTITSLSAGAFDALARYIVDEAERLSKIVTRAALAHPRGIVGAAVGGFFAVHSAPFATTTHLSRLEALQELGPFAQERAAAVAELVERLSVSTNEVEALDAYLRVNPTVTSLPEVARAIGVSPRTLQRRMAEAGTTFFDRLQSARIGQACEMLHDRGRTVTEVALSLGFKTTQHFSATFRARRGLSPTRFQREVTSGEADPAGT